MNTRRLMAACVALAGIALLPLPAHATIAFACESDEPAVQFEINGAYGTSIGSSLANFGGNLRILSPDAPKEVRAIKLTRKHVVQQWFVDRDVKFLLRFEHPKPYREVTLIIDTRRETDDEIDPHEGSYTLTIEMPPASPSRDTRRIELKGKASCEAG